MIVIVLVYLENKPNKLVMIMALKLRHKCILSNEYHLMGDLIEFDCNSNEINEIRLRIFDFTIQFTHHLINAYAI